MSGLAEIVRLRTADCRHAAEYLPILAGRERPTDEGSVDGDPGVGWSDQDAPEHVFRHVARCVRCQAEMAAYRRILRHLRALRQDEVRSPPGALAAVLAALEAAALEDHASGSHRVLRVAAVGGITVATAAATTAGVLVWMSRRRMGLAQTG